MLVEEDFHNKEIQVDPLNQLPCKGTEEEVVKESGNGRADAIRAMYRGAVHPHQEDNLGQTEGHRQLTMNVV